MVQYWMIDDRELTSVVWEIARGSPPRAIFLWRNALGCDVSIPPALIWNKGFALAHALWPRQSCVMADAVYASPEKRTLHAIDSGRRAIQMRTRTLVAGRLLALCGAVTLAACQDALTAPRHDVRATFGSGCDGPMDAHVGRSSPSHVAPNLSISSPPQLNGVTVTANYPGLPWNIMQQMNFPLNSGAGQLPCFNSPSVTFIAETLYVAAELDIPTPDGVDAEWWASLSPRERRALMKLAQELLILYPDRYGKVSSVIIDVFERPMLRAKVNAKIRAADFFGASQEAELFAGGVYGCTLYQDFVAQSNWHWSNAQTRDIVIDLVTAFAEAEFTTRPLRAMLFGRNGAIGAAMAAHDGYGGDCGRLIFDSIAGGRIDVTDPYLTPRGSPTPPAPPGGGYQPPLPPSDGNPPGWMDQ